MRERPTFRERLWAGIARGGPYECWPWTRNKTPQGYGLIWRSSVQGAGRSVLTHRAVYEDQVGPIPAGLLVCHRCDRPACCNPAHLFVGTAQDNVDDMISKGRNRVGKGPYGESHHLAKLSYRAADEIRGAYEEGMSCASLARAYGVAYTAIVQVVRGKTWRRR